MSILHRICLERRIRRSLVIVMGIVLIAPIVSAGPQLWLYPKDAGPREGGHVVPPGPFTLVIENRGKASEDNTAQSVELVIAVEDPGSVTLLQLSYDGGGPMDLDPSGWEEGIPVLPCSEKPMPRHGEYPAAFTTVTLDELTQIGDLVGGQIVEIEVTVEGDEGLRVHFDATATGYKTTGQGERCFDISSPPGHDVTVANRRGGEDSCGHVSISKTTETRSVEYLDTVTFLIEVLNDGTCDLTEPVLQDLIPAVEDETGTSYPAFQWTGETMPAPNEIDEFHLEWPLPTIAVGEIVIVELVVEFDEPLAVGRRIKNRACITAPELKKPRCASAIVMVGIPDLEGGPAGPGFWCHATRWLIEDRPNVPIEGEELLAWLALIDDDSEVYSELYPIIVPDDPAASLVATAAILCSPQDAVGPADRLARHLLTLWFNVVSERLDPILTLRELCMGDELLPDGVDLDTTVGALLDEVDAGLAAGDEDEQLNYWSEVVDAVNNAYVSDDGECAEQRSVTRNQRKGNGRSRGNLGNSHGGH
jgi:uncharacterized repeat protein (TIGR01451 family)